MVSNVVNAERAECALRASHILCDEEQLASGEVATIAEIARRENVTDRYVSALLKLAFLSPELVQAALQGRAPSGLSVKRLTLDRDLPLLWSEQGAASGTYTPAPLDRPCAAF